jgi:hypothetical protein
MDTSIHHYSRRAREGFHVNLSRGVRWQDIEMLAQRSLRERKLHPAKGGMTNSAQEKVK